MGSGTFIRWSSESARIGASVSQGDVTDGRLTVRRMNDRKFSFPLGECANIEPFGGNIVGQDALKIIWPNGSVIPYGDV